MREVLPMHPLFPWFHFVKQGFVHYAAPIGVCHIVVTITTAIYGVLATLANMFVPDPYWVLWVFGFVLLDTLLGIILAFADKERAFEPRRLIDTLVKLALYIVPLSAAHAFAHNSEIPFDLHWLEMTMGVYVGYLETVSIYRNAKMLPFLQWAIQRVKPIIEDLPPVELRDKKPNESDNSDNTSM